MPYTHLTLAERKVLYFMRWQGFSFSAIGQALGRHKSTLSREIKRNTTSGQQYDPGSGDTRYRGARRNLAVRSKTKDARLMAYVVARLKEGWAPEQIAGRMRREQRQGRRKRTISAQTIYRYIWEDKAHNGNLFKYLRHRGKPYRSRKGGGRRVIIRDRVLIDERPEIVEQRGRVGDWEGDTMVGRAHRSFVATCVERTTQYLVAHKMDDKRACSLNRAFKAGFRSVPRELVQTLTFDNGTEFAAFKDLEAHFDADVFFAHPYSSWERGLNENTNGLLRQFIPKKTDLNQVSHEELDIYVNRLNNRPRKKLDYRTPREALQEAIVALRT